MEKPIRFKRYANRRLYNTRDSSYVTLNQVSQLIKSGNQVEVIDAKTGKDVTAYTLTQLLVEEARLKNFLMPVPLLHLMIQYGDSLLAEFFEKYLELAIRNFVVYKGAADEQFRRWMEAGMGLAGISAGSLNEILSRFHSMTRWGSSRDRDGK